MAYMLLAAATDYATAPHIAAYDITGDIDIRVRAALDDWVPGTVQTMILKVATGGLDYQFDIDTAGAPRLVYHNGTSNVLRTATAATGLSAGATKWVRVTLDVDNGSTQNEVKFYLSDDGAAWSQLGATVTNAGVTQIRGAVGPLRIGQTGSGGQVALGKYYRAQIYNGIDGTLVFDADPSDSNTWNGARTTFIEKANSATVTLAGNASLVGGSWPLQLLGVG